MCIMCANFRRIRMTAPVTPRRPRWRNLALLALLLAPLLWPLQQLAERYYSNELIEQNRQTLDLYVANLLGILSRYEVLPRILGDLPALRAALHGAEEPAVRDSANRLLKKLDRKSTRLNSSHVKNSYAVFC